MKKTQNDTKLAAGKLWGVMVAMSVFLYCNNGVCGPSGAAIEGTEKAGAAAVRYIEETGAWKKFVTLWKGSPKTVPTPEPKFESFSKDSSLFNTRDTSRIDFTHPDRNLNTGTSDKTDTSLLSSKSRDYSDTEESNTTSLFGSKDYDSTDTPKSSSSLFDSKSETSGDTPPSSTSPSFHFKSEDSTETPQRSKSLSQHYQEQKLKRQLQEQLIENEGQTCPECNGARSFSATDIYGRTSYFKCYRCGGTGKISR